MRWCVIGGKMTGLHAETLHGGNSDLANSCVLYDSDCE